MGDRGSGDRGDALGAVDDAIVDAGVTDQELSDAERFARELVRRSVSLAGVRIDRSSFFRIELPKYNADIDVDLAIESSPMGAGMTSEQVDKAARDVIDFETKKCAAISFAVGIPGGLALAGTVPADLVQYFAHVLRVEQKLAYLYGWQTFLNEDDEIADDTVFELVLLMGVMLGVGGSCCKPHEICARGCDAEHREAHRSSSADQDRLVPGNEKGTWCDWDSCYKRSFRENCLQGRTRYRWSYIRWYDVCVV